MFISAAGSRPHHAAGGPTQPGRARARRGAYDAASAFRALAACTSDSVLVTDAGGVILFANPAALSFLGLTSDCAGISLTALGFPLEALESAISTKRAVSGTVRGAPFSATPLVRSRLGVPVMRALTIVINAPLMAPPVAAVTDPAETSTVDEGGAPLGGVPETLAQSEALRETEAKLRSAIGTTGLGVWQIDVSTPGQFDWSPRMREIWGVAPQEMITPTLAESLVHPDDRAMVNAGVHLALDPAGDGKFFAEHRICRPDGRTAYVLSWAQCAFEGEGRARRPTRMIGYVLDVTDRKVAEYERERLEDQVAVDQALLKAVVDQMPAGVVIAEAPSGRILLENAEAERCGIQQAVSGNTNSVVDVQAFHSDGTPYQSDELPLARTLRSGHHILNEEVTLREPASAARVVAVSSSPVVDRQGRVRAVVALDHDITDRKRDEALLVRHVQRQRALAALSREALAGGDLLPLFRTAANIIRDTLAADFSIAAEREPNGCCCVIRAATGWPESLEGRPLPCPLSRDAGAVTVCGEDVAVLDNLGGSTYLRGVEFLAECAAEAGIAVPVKGFERRFGTLAAFTKQARTFTEDEIDFLSSAANILAMAIERRRKEQLESTRSVMLMGTLHALADRPGLEAILVNVLAHLKSLLDCQSIGFWLFDSRTNSMSLQMTFTEAGELQAADEDHPLAKHPISVLHLPAWPRVRSSTEPYFIDIEKEPKAPFREWYLENGITASLIVPMQLDNETLGWLVARCSNTDRYSPEQLAIAQALAQRAALAVYMERLASAGKRTAVLNERNRIAREIHDTLAQGFSGIALQLEAARVALDRNLESARTCVASARELARQNLAEARRSVWALRPPIQGEGGLPEAFRTALETVTRGAAMTAQFALHGTPRSLAEDVELDILRIGVEAVTNAVKHSRASAVDVTLTYGHRRLWLAVTDNGDGFDPQSVPPGSFGITSMRERADRLGASLFLTSAAGQGARVELILGYSRGKEDRLP